METAVAGPSFMEIPRRFTKNQRHILSLDVLKATEEIGLSVIRFVTELSKTS